MTDWDKCIFDMQDLEKAFKAGLSTAEDYVEFEMDPDAEFLAWYNREMM